MDMESFMKKSNSLLTASLAFICLGFSLPAFSAVDADAPRIFLRTSCQENGQTVDNCFTDLNTLNTWIWNTRTPAPSTSAPLSVEIGPGIFTGQFTCNNSGHVSLIGSGIQNTVITNSSLPVTTTDCENLVFKHLNLKNTVTLFGVKNAGGSTVWDNVEIDGLGYAWFDTPGGCSGNVGKHYWFSSRIVSAASAANSSTAYFNACDESWFFGSEITSKGTVGSSTPIVAVGGEVHVYGSVIRALPEDGAIMSKVTAVTATNTAEIHIHGTGIDVISSEPNNIVALDASAGGQIHANESSYVLKTGTGGDITRVNNNGGTILAPYLWQTGANPPVVTSVTGYDTAIITNTSDNHPHMVIYDSSCTSNWFDINSSACH
jgi:hypothetical protein